MPKFVIVVDAQRDFMALDGALPVPGADALVGPMNGWLAALRPEDTAGVLMTFDTHHADTYPLTAEAERFPLHCVRGSEGWATMLDPGLIDPAVPLHRLEKGVFAMWEEPDVVVEDARDPDATPVARDRFFDALKARGVEEVMVIGVAADYCVRWAVEGLLDRGFRVTVPAALTRGIARGIEAVAAEEWAGRPVAVA